jgi:uncharacterized UBP type Zn finger protein
MPGPFPGKLFDFKMVTRLQCTGCNGVIYRETLTNCIENMEIPIDYSTDSDELTVPFENCLTSLAAEEPVDLNCPDCGCTKIFNMTKRLATFPKVLVVHM